VTSLERRKFATASTRVAGILRGGDLLLFFAASMALGCDALDELAVEVVEADAASARSPQGAGRAGISANHWATMWSE
jgi:hypothetical protein